MSQIFFCWTSEETQTPPWMRSRRRCREWSWRRTTRWTARCFANSKLVMPMRELKRYKKLLFFTTTLKSIIVHTHAKIYTKIYIEFDNWCDKLKDDWIDWQFIHDFEIAIKIQSYANAWRSRLASKCYVKISSVKFDHMICYFNAKNTKC